MRHLRAITTLALLAGCAESATAPTTRTFASVSINGASTIPLIHYCTPASSSTEQWVSQGIAKLTVYADGSFELNASSETGSALYHMNGTIRVYDQQSASGGSYGIAGSSVTDGDGTRTLSFERATSIYGDPSEYSGRLSGDSAIVTHIMKCDHPAAPDSTYTFVTVLR